MDIQSYLDQVRAKYASGQATEHSYRPALQSLFESIDPALTVINEPKRSDAGMPDFLFRRGDVPVGWVEAKDVDKDVIKLKGYSVEQRQRYTRAYPNLIYTNGVDFEFIREGEGVHFVSIADFLMGLQPRPDQFEPLARQLRNFAAAKPISIRSAKQLAGIMAAKAAIIKDEVALALKDDPGFRTGLGGQFKSFKANLLPATSCQVGNRGRERQILSQSGSRTARYAACRTRRFRSQALLGPVVTGTKFCSPQREK